MSQCDRNCYVYILYREDGVTPFYVGMGTGTRWLDHERKAFRGRSRLKDNIICKMRDQGIPVPKEKIIEGVPRKVAAFIEVSAIWMLGRAPSGPLVNATGGGDGMSNHTPEILEKLRVAAQRQWQSADSRQRLIDASRRRFSNPAELERLALIGRQASAMMTPEQREKGYATLRLSAAQPEAIEKRRVAARLGWEKRRSGLS